MRPDRLQSEIEFRQLPPIPKESVEGWEKIPIKGIKQELIPLGPFTDFDNCDTNAVYFGERGGGPEMDFIGSPLNFVGRKIDREKSLLTPFVRKDVYDRLVMAQTALPKGYFFRFYDGYRPFAVQQELYDTQRQIIASKHSDWSSGQIEEETHKFIATPAIDSESRTNRPSPHTTGAAIDLGLIKLSEEGQKLLEVLEQKKAAGKLNSPVKLEEEKTFQQAQGWIDAQNLPDDVKQNWLAQYRYGIQKALIFRKYAETVDMGTAFDSFEDKAAMDYYENRPDLSDEEVKIRDNRRLFYKVMNDAGFLSYPKEWWHFSFGDQEWAANKKQETALFGEVGLEEYDPSNRAMENARRLVYLKTIRKIRKNNKLPFLGA